MIAYVHPRTATAPTTVEVIQTADAPPTVAVEVPTGLAHFDADQARALAAALITAANQIDHVPRTIRRARDVDEQLREHALEP
jgi:hypothetical protein